MTSLGQVTLLIMKVASPLLFIIGGFGNIVTIVVFCRLKDYPAISTYCIALAISDLVALYFGMLSQTWIQYQFNVFILCLHPVICKMVIAVHYMSSALSSWFLVAMTVQRAMAVVWPHRVNVVCTRHVSQGVTAGIILVILALYSHIFYGFSMSTCGSSPCAIWNCTCVIDVHYSYFFYHIWSWVDLMVASLGPFVLLLVSNIVLVRAVLTSVRNVRQTLSVGQSMHVTARERRVSSMSLTLITLSVTFFVLTGPFRVQMIVDPLLTIEAPAQKGVRNVVFYLLYAVCITNNAANFYLYCLTGKKFKKDVVRLLCGLFLRK